MGGRAGREPTDMMFTESPVIVVSPDFLPELKGMPDSILSMSAAVDEVRAPLRVPAVEERS